MSADSVADWNGAKPPSGKERHPRCIEPRSDIYSLGVILCELAVGEPPFEGNAISVLRQPLRRREPGPVSRLRSSGELAWRVFDKIVGRCLAKSPDARYASASDIAADLARLGAALARARDVAFTPAASAASPTARGAISRPAPERRSGIRLRPAQYPPKSRARPQAAEGDRSRGTTGVRDGAKPCTGIRAVLQAWHPACRQRRRAPPPVRALASLRAT